MRPTGPLAEGNGPPTRPGPWPPADFPAPVRALAAVARGLAAAEGVGLAVCLLVLVALAVYQFAARNLNLHGVHAVPPPPIWIDGVIRHAVFLLGFLGAAYAAFSGRHFRIDALTRLLGVRPRLMMRIVVTLAAVALCAIIMKAGLAFWYITRDEAGDASSQEEIFTSARGAVVILGGVGLVAFHFLVQAIVDATYVITGRVPPAAWVAEVGHGNPSAKTGEAP